MRPAALAKRALMAIQEPLHGAVEGPECTCATLFARAFARGNRFHGISLVTRASHNGAQHGPSVGTTLRRQSRNLISPAKFFC